MKSVKLRTFFVTMCLPLFAQAEIWKDYEPSEAVSELRVLDVKANHMDDYLMNLERTWVRWMEVEKALGNVVSYDVWTSDRADSPNIWLMTTYKNFAAMQGSEAQYDEVEARLKVLGRDDAEHDATLKAYEDIREHVDYAIIRRVIYK